MVYRFYGQACSGPCIGESCHFWATIRTKQCNRTFFIRMHSLNTRLPLGSGMYSTVRMLLTHAGLVWLKTSGWSETTRNFFLAQCFCQSSLEHTSVSDVRPDCSSTRTRPAKRSLTDHINGRFCISKPLSVTDTLTLIAYHHHQGLSPSKPSEQHAEISEA